MSIRNSGQIIKEARKNAGLSQFEVCNGLCSTTAYSKIENDKLGVSPMLFKSLMERTGNFVNAYPVFKNENDYICYKLLVKAKKQLLNWELSEAYNTVTKIYELNANNNMLYWQSTMLYYSFIQYRSYTCDYEHIERTLLAAIKLTTPDLNRFDLRRYTFSLAEYQMLLLYANILMNKSDMSTALTILSQIYHQISNICCDDLETKRVKLLSNLCYAKYLFLSKDYANAKEYIDSAAELVS